MSYHRSPRPGPSLLLAARRRNIEGKTSAPWRRRKEFWEGDKKVQLLGGLGVFKREIAGRDVDSLAPELGISKSLMYQQLVAGGRGWTGGCLVCARSRARGGRNSESA